MFNSESLLHAVLLCICCCRLWDLTIGKCRQVLRGHVDSVNDINWQPYGSAICTGVQIHSTCHRLCRQMCVHSPQAGALHQLAVDTYAEPAQHGSC